MKIMRWELLFFVAAAVFFAGGTAQAHCAWIEGPAVVKPGVASEFRIFWADPDKPVDKRDNAHLDLQLSDHDGVIALPPTERHPTFQQSIVALEHPGFYTLTAIREPTRHRFTQYRDFAKLLLLAQEYPTPLVSPELPPPVGLELEIIPLASPAEAGGLLSLQVFFFNQPLAGASVRLIASVTPESETYHSLHDDKSSRTFVADQQGRVEVTYDPTYRQIFKVRHEAKANEVAGGQGRLVRSVVFRSTLALP